MENTTAISGTQQIYWNSERKCNVEVWMHHVNGRDYWHHMHDLPTEKFDFWEDLKGDVVEKPEGAK